MAAFEATISSARSPEATLEYLADFANAVEWDPATVAAERLDPGPPVVGSRYLLTGRFLGRSVPMEYRIVELDRPRSLLLVAELGWVRSVDRITVEPGPGPDGQGDGAVLTYDARLEPTSAVARVADPVINVFFQRLGSGGADGLRRELGRRP